MANGNNPTEIPNTRQGYKDVLDEVDLKKDVVKMKENELRKYGEKLKNCRSKLDKMIKAEEDEIFRGFQDDFLSEHREYLSGRKFNMDEMGGKLEENRQNYDNGEIRNADSFRLIFGLSDIEESILFGRENIAQNAVGDFMLWATAMSAFSDDVKADVSGAKNIDDDSLVGLQDFGEKGRELFDLIKKEQPSSSGLQVGEQFRLHQLMREYFVHIFGGENGYTTWDTNSGGYKESFLNRLGVEREKLDADTDLGISINELFDSDAFQEDRFEDMMKMAELQADYAKWAHQVYRSHGVTLEELRDKRNEVSDKLLQVDYVGEFRNALTSALNAKTQENKNQAFRVLSGIVMKMGGRVPSSLQKDYEKFCSLVTTGRQAQFLLYREKQKLGRSLINSRRSFGEALVHGSGDDWMRMGLGLLGLTYGIARFFGKNEKTGKKSWWGMFSGAAIAGMSVWGLKNVAETGRFDIERAAWWTDFSKKNDRIRREVEGFLQNIGDGFGEKVSDVTMNMRVRGESGQRTSLRSFFRDHPPSVTADGYVITDEDLLKLSGGESHDNLGNFSLDRLGNVNTDEGKRLRKEYYNNLYQLYTYCEAQPYDTVRECFHGFHPLGGVGSWLGDEAGELNRSFWSWVKGDSFRRHFKWRLKGEGIGPNSS